MGKGQKRLSFIILAIVLVVVLFVSLIGFIADFLWFKEMGYLSVFFKKLVTQLTVGVPTFIVVTGLVYLYLSKLKKGYFSKIASSEETDMKKLRKTTIALSAVFGIFATDDDNAAVVRDIEICQRHIVRHIGSAVQHGYIVLYI